MPFSLELTSAQHDLVERTHRFAEEVVRPVAAQYDREEEFPWPVLERNGLTLQDFDFYEIHEAFAAQVAFTLKAWESREFCRERLGLDDALGSIDRSKLNVSGGSLAAGHPFAATGGRIVATLAKLLAERGSGRGLVSICAAGGQGVVAVMEK